MLRIMHQPLCTRTARHRDKLSMDSANKCECRKPFIIPNYILYDAFGGMAPQRPPLPLKFCHATAAYNYLPSYHLLTIAHFIPSSVTQLGIYGITVQQRTTPVYSRYVPWTQLVDMQLFRTETCTIPYSDISTTYSQRVKNTV